MIEIFVNLLERSILAGIMIIVLMLVRLVLRKLPGSIYCLLWCLVGVRLICPFTMESTFSLMPQINISRVSLSEVPEVSSKLITEIIQTYQQDSGETTSQVNEAGISDSYVLLREDEDKITHLLVAPPVFMEGLAVVWLVGMIALVLYSGISYLCLKRKVYDAVLWKPVSEKVKNYHRHIYQSDKVSSPCVLGMFCPKIYIPYHLGQEECTNIIAHEQAHIERGDYIVKPMSFLLLAVYWFHPLIWVWYVLLCKDMELACDERVMKDMDLEQRKSYAHTLLACSSGHKMMMVYPLAFGEVGVAARIKNVLHYKKPTVWIFIFCSIACAVLAVCLMTGPKKEMAEAVQIDGEESVNREIIRSEDGYQAPDGLVYQYCHVLSGTFNNAASECTLLVYTNKPEVTFKEAEKRFFSSSLLHYYSMYIDCYSYAEETEVFGEYNTLPNVSLSLEEVTASRAIMKLHNKSGAAVEFGAQYSLQGWKNGAWHELPTIFDNYAWNAILYSVQNNIYTNEITWAHYGILPSGRYRFVKTVKHGDNEYLLASEFEIK